MNAATHVSLAINVYVIISLISDFLNYFVFVILNLSIDIYMLVRLRRTLKEKMQRFAKLSDKKQAKQKKLEMSHSINNAIRMVIVNSTFNILFKMPQILVPLENAIETFYFHGKIYDCVYNPITCHLGISTFSEHLRDSFVYYMLPDLSEWLYNILISIQLFLYAHFDKNIKIGLNQLKFPCKRESTNLEQKL